MKTLENNVSLDLFKNSVLNSILKQSDGIYHINLDSQTYTSIKSTDLFDSILGESGSYADMFALFFLAKDSELDSGTYDSFIQNGLPAESIYSRRIHVHSGQQMFLYTLTYFPEEGSASGYMVLTPVKDTKHFDFLADTRNKVLADSYLYTMLVDLAEDKCFHPHVSEMYRAGDATPELSFTRWRSAISKSFPREYLPLFLEKTNPSYIYKQLESEKRYSYELQMHNLEGQLIWTRHSVIRIRDEENDHLIFLYSVQDIDEEKKQLMQQLRLLQEKESREEEPEPFLFPKLQDIPDEKSFSALSIVILDQVEREIREHYMHKLSLQQMADKYYINSAYLGQLFIRKYKMTFHEYLNSQRMNKAAHLLATSNYTVRQIIDMVGISSPHYFNRLFRIYFGCTPTFYRKTAKV